MPKVSVVIPVYNGEAYLRQCLDSVCAQTLKEIEIICVDDGSTDSSWEILEEYREKDPRFRLFQQENLHPGIARNNGLSHAQGKYVIYWDCDDFFEPRALERLYLRAEETGAEICVCSHDIIDNATGEQYPAGDCLKLWRLPAADTFNRFTAPDRILFFTNISVWTKLFLRTFLVENDIKFPNFQTGEDVPVSRIALCTASRIAVVNEVFVHHRWNNSNSLMGGNLLFAQEQMNAYEYAVDQLIERDIVPEDSLSRMMIGSIRKALQITDTEADFMDVYHICTKEKNGSTLIQKSRIAERDPKYYGAEEEFVRRLLHSTPVDLMAFMMHDYWNKASLSAAKRRGAETELKEMKAESKALKAELKKTKDKLKKTKKKLDALRTSRSYRLGQALLFLPRKILSLFRRGV